MIEPAVFVLAKLPGQSADAWRAVQVLDPAQCRHAETICTKCQPDWDYDWVLVGNLAKWSEHWHEISSDFILPFVLAATLGHPLNSIDGPTSPTSPA